MKVRIRMKMTQPLIATIAILSLTVALAGGLSAHNYHGRQAAGTKEAAKPETKPINLLANPGVEEGTGASPDNWKMGAPVAGVRYIWYNDGGYKSKRSLCMRKTANRFYPIAEWTQTIPCPSGTNQLTVSAYVRAQELGKAVLDVQFRGADEASLGHKWAAYIGPEKADDPPLDHDWKRCSATVDIPEGTKQIVIAPQIYGPGSVWFDDLSAAPVP